MVKYHMLSIPGDREVNEDALRICKEGNAFCAVLADGLGGHGFGNIASTNVTECFVRQFRHDNEASKIRIMQEISGCQEQLLQEQAAQEKQFSMKTTICALLVDEERMVWGHVGDSRLYHFREGKLVERTFDHSVPQMLVYAGEISEDQVSMHPDRNRLLRCLGTEWPHPMYTISEELPFEEGHAFLLCSDGFWEWLTDIQIEDCLKGSIGPEDWLEKMYRVIQETIKEKDMDNCSAITIWT